ncbi:hypothetical protein FACS18942_02860 [Planctomycetales bacterium]|nr:hypothetical protein FACS18942_02860 [Planctomycetales bacterium]GHT35348.1 hypothetical protein FACS189427_04430 [Planctomycetales bacterium]
MIDEIDVVQMIREIREKHWNEIKDLSREEQKKAISERSARAIAAYDEWEKNYCAEKTETSSEATR